MDRVQQALKARYWSEIARATGTTPGFISLLFRGKRSARVVTLGKIAKVLGVSLDELHEYLNKARKNNRGYGWRKPAGEAA